MDLKFGVCHWLQCAAFGFVLCCTHSANGTELDGGKAYQHSYVATMLPECACGERLGGEWVIIAGAREGGGGEG